MGNRGQKNAHGTNATVVPLAQMACGACAAAKAANNIHQTKKCWFEQGVPCHMFFGCAVSIRSCASQNRSSQLKVSFGGNVALGDPLAALGLPIRVALRPNSVTCTLGTSMCGIIRGRTPAQCMSSNDSCQPKATTTTFVSPMWSEFNSY